MWVYDFKTKSEPYCIFFTLIYNDFLRSLPLQAVMDSVLIDPGRPSQKQKMICPENLPHGGSSVSGVQGKQVTSTLSPVHWESECLATRPAAVLEAICNQSTEIQPWLRRQFVNVTCVS